MWRRKHDNIFSRFDTVPACDRRTDGRPAYIYYVLQHSIADARKKLKRKPLSSPVSVKAVRCKGWVYGGKDLRKRYLLSLEQKRVGVMDNDSGDDGTERLSVKYMSTERDGSKKVKKIR